MQHVYHTRTNVVSPDVVAIFGIECSLLERPQLEREPWTQLLHTNLLGIAKNIPKNEKFYQ